MAVSPLHAAIGPVVADGTHQDLSGETVTGAQDQYQGHALSAVNGGSIDGENLNSVAFDSELVSGGAPRDVYEAKAGAQLQMGGGWTSWGELGVRRGEADYQDIGAQIGAKYSW